MNKYSRFLSFAAILVCLTPLGGVYTLFQTFPWTNVGNSNLQHPHRNIVQDESSLFQHMDGPRNRTCAAYNLMDASRDSMDPVRYDADSFLDTSTYRPSNTTRPSRRKGNHQSHIQQDSRSLNQRQQPQLDPRMFHVRNNEFYNHFNSSNNHVLLLSWTLSLLLGLLVPVVALLYDAYLRITSKSRHQKQLRAIQKALKPYKRKVLTKSQAKETCPICLSQFAMGESILACGQGGCAEKSIPNSVPSGCSHCFHQSCMVQWLVQQTKQQPNQLETLINTASMANESTVSTRRKRRTKKLATPCPCCRQPFVTIPLVR